jgi:flagellar L-ring protein precursor FlgH
MKKNLLLILFACVTAYTFAKPIGSLYADHKSFSIGDIITIIIEESATASSSAKAKAAKSASHSVGTQLGQGPLGFIPLSSASGSSSNSSLGDASTARSGSLEAKITAKIENIDTNGNLLIVGYKEVRINGELERTKIEGTVRPQDIDSDNTVYSYHIADAKISYTGKGQVNDGSKIGFISRILNFIF